MTRIEDMSETQCQSWITLLADGAVFIWIWQKMTIGLSPQVVHNDMGEFGALIIRAIIITVILHAVIASIFELRKRKEAYEKDERDIQIEHKGAHAGYGILQFGVGGIMYMMFMHNWLEADYTPTFSMQTPVEIIFALLVVSYVASLVKYGVMIFAYRGE